jgi:heat shock protein HslJ
MLKKKTNLLKENKMNRYVQLTALFAVIIFLQTSCASAPEFTDVRDKDWKLMEVRSRTESAFGKNNVIFQRNMLTQEVPGDVFTLRFDSERVSGAGCPNRYFSPYTLGEKQAISIQPIASTLMLALSEPEQLKEREFFSYLEKANKWTIRKGNLKLYSTNNEGAVVYLVFSLTD